MEDGEVQGSRAQAIGMALSNGGDEISSGTHQIIFLCYSTEGGSMGVLLC